MQSGRAHLAIVNADGSFADQSVEEYLTGLITSVAGALITASNDGATGLSIPAQWQWAGITDTPSWGSMGADAAPAEATMLYFHENAQVGGNVGTLIEKVAAGWGIYGVSVVDTNAAGRFTATGPAVRTGDVIAIPVTPVVLGSASLNGWEQITIVFASAAGQ